MTPGRCGRWPLPCPWRVRLLRCRSASEIVATDVRMFSLLVSRCAGDNILAKVRMGSYQGLRHQMCLPCHGQRTRSNAKTQRKLGARRAELFNIPLLSKKAKQSAGSGGTPAGGKAK